MLQAILVMIHFMIFCFCLFPLSGNFDSSNNADQFIAAQKAFSRHVIVFTPFAATALGLLAVGLLALWENYEHKKLEEFLDNNAMLIGKASSAIAIRDNDSFLTLTGLRVRCSSRY